MGGAETHEMDIFGPHTSSPASLLRSVSPGQDINDEAKSIVSHAQGVVFVWPYCRIPRRLYCSVTESGRSDAPEMNADHELAEAQPRACFLTIVEISMA